MVCGSCIMVESMCVGVMVNCRVFSVFLSFLRFLHVPREKKISKKSLPPPNHLPLLILQGIWNRQRCPCCLGAVCIKFS